MRWPETEHDGACFLAGVFWALVVFWAVVFVVTYLMLGGG